MQIEMQNAEALTGQQITEFLKGSEGIAFTGGDRASIYGVRQLLNRIRQREDWQVECNQHKRHKNTHEHHNQRLNQ